MRAAKIKNMTRGAVHWGPPCKTEQANTMCAFESTEANVKIRVSYRTVRLLDIIWPGLALDALRYRNNRGGKWVKGCRISLRGEVC
jgi:hypothetical protein